MMENSRHAWDRKRERPCHRNFEVIQVPAGRFLKDSLLKRKALGTLRLGHSEFPRVCYLVRWFLP